MQTSFLDNIIQAVSWTLLHSMWQGLIVAVIAGIIIMATRRASASLRYSLLCTLFFLFLGGALVSFLVEWNAANSLNHLSNSSSGSAASNPDSPTLIQSLFTEFTIFFNANAYWIVLIWALLLAFKITGMIIGLRQVHQLRNQHIHSPHEDWHRRLELLGNKMGLRKKVILAESALVRIPIILGHFKPIILVPIGALTHLAPAEVEAVLLHELAHIRRHDFLVNLIQRFSEAIFFFNPGLLWISQLLRTERENCCDDLAISQTNNRLQFAEALISFKEHSIKQPAYALGLFGDRKQLVQRMTRLVYNRQRSLSLVESLFLAFSLVMLLALTAGVNRPRQEVMASQLHSLYTNSILMATPDLRYETISEIDNRRSTIVSSSTKRQRTTSPEKQEQVQADEAKYVADLNLYNSLKYEAPTQLDVSAANHPDRERLQADMDRRQAEKDRLQAEVDRKQAEKDRKQADIDRARADLDRKIADQDRVEADKARRLADIDRANADIERQKAEQDRKIFRRI